MAIIIAALWLTTCAHMGSQDPVRAEKENPSENDSDNRTPPKEPVASAQRELPEQSQTDHPDSQNKTKAEPQAEVGQKPQRGQIDSRAAAGSGSEESADQKTEGRKISAGAAGARLEEARQKLATSRETEARIASELDQLKKSGNASSEAVQDYEEYLARVRAMTAENQRIVDRMETAYTRHSPSDAGPVPAASGNPDRMFDPDIPEEQTEDEVAALDRELNESLARFDDRLLKEMDAIRAGSAKKLKDLAQEAAEAAKRLRDKGVDVDTSGKQSSGETGTGKEGPVAGRETEAAESGDETKTAARDGSSGGAKGARAQDRDRTDYEDDDIVARQLREAAENETDPELKEKLWKEYEEYKKSK